MYCELICIVVSVSVDKGQDIWWWKCSGLHYTVVRAVLSTVTEQSLATWSSDAVYLLTVYFLRVVVYNQYHGATHSFVLEDCLGKLHTSNSSLAKDVHKMTHTWIPLKLRVPRLTQSQVSVINHEVKIWAVIQSYTADSRYRKEILFVSSSCVT